ncbi:uncharacterized protein LOC128728399 [Anopheles nili]|uniref:uncharacterized protein LOC128728399 n=1 Tax=Anopheles nili TaxID=185578 RepID=UPI00237BEFE9|nr:uncharacterized protein LOC128728399 [Anopheles nili]
MMYATDCLFVNPSPMALMSSIRHNTVRCNFSFLNRNLCALETHDFVAHYLRVAPEQITRLQWNGQQRCLYLQLVDFATARYLVTEHHRRHKYPAGREARRVSISFADAIDEILLYDLSELVTDEQIRVGLNPYGVVVGIAHNSWSTALPYGGVPSGHRLVHIVLRRSLPELVKIGDEVAFVAQSGQQRRLYQNSWKARTQNFFRELFCFGCYAYTR